MPLHVRNIAGRSAFEVCCQGRITDQDMIESARQVMSMEESFPVWRFAIIDLQADVVLDLDFHEIQAAALRHQQMSGALHEGFLVAVIAPKDVQFGLARMWQSFADATGWEINVLRSRSEAEAWLRGRAAYKFDLHISTFEAA